MATPVPVKDSTVGPVTKPVKNSSPVNDSTVGPV